MKMITLILALSMLSSTLTAPPFESFIIIAASAVNYYDPLIKAVNLVEVKDGRVLYNPIENAVGWFQIRQIRVDHYNKLTRSNYKLEDFYDYQLSRKMFLYYTRGRDYETVAREWNGSGRMTLVYWEKVKKYL